jgi:hypothetical protein
MSLAAQQSRFIEALMSNEAPLPKSWQERQRAGYQVYRNAYRARLIDVLRETYPRTARLVGEDAFQAAAAHHLITCPPTSWTIDDAGRGFTDTAQTLFANDPEVAELAWIEWAMQAAFTAHDTPPLDGPGLVAATASFDDEAWQDLRLDFVPGLAVRQVRHDCTTLWHLLADEENLPAARDLPPLAEAQGCVVWREGLHATFTTIETTETEALQAMVNGGSYGAACDLLITAMGEEQALTCAGVMLARWLGHGWIAALRL